MGTDIFQATADAPLVGGGNYFLAGQYLVEVRDCKIIDSQRKPGIEYAIVETAVIDTTVDEYNEGDTVTWRVDLSQLPAPSNLRRFVLAVGEACFEGFENADIDAELVETVFTKWKEFLAAHEIEKVWLKVEATTIKTRAGNPFTKLLWAAPDRDFVDSGDEE